MSLKNTTIPQGGDEPVPTVDNENKRIKLLIPRGGDGAIHAIVITITINV